MSLVEKTAGLISPRKGEIQNGSDPWTPGALTKAEPPVQPSESPRPATRSHKDERYSIPTKKKEVRVALGVRVTQEDMEKLEKLAQKTNATKQSLIDVALRHLFDSNSNR